MKITFKRKFSKKSTNPLQLCYTIPKKFIDNGTYKENDKRKHHIEVFIPDSFNNNTDNKEEETK